MMTSYSWVGCGFELGQDGNFHWYERTTAPKLWEPNGAPIEYNVTVTGDCGKRHASFEEWQQCATCERSLKWARIV